MNSIQKGDVVRLKSGGPKMTANMKMGPEIWNCTWFEGTELKGGNFSEPSLEKEPDEKDVDVATESPYAGLPVSSSDL